MNFYDPVTEKNAAEWYHELPPHLKKQLDEKKSTFRRGEDCQRKELPELYLAVEKELGKRPLRPPEPADPLDGHTMAQIEQINALKRWGARYDELLLASLCVEIAPTVQRERKALNEAMGINVEAGALPLQSDGLDPTLSATIRWLQLSGEMPLEFLARTYRDEEAKMSDRLTAARTLMDYVHRKLPSKAEIETKDITEPKLSKEVLKGLSAKELDMLETLMSKMLVNK
jgi:BarA-like signal transduction histidine kinase